MVCRMLPMPVAVTPTKRELERDARALAVVVRRRIIRIRLVIVPPHHAAMRPVVAMISLHMAVVAVPLVHLNDTRAWSCLIQHGGGGTDGAGLRRGGSCERAGDPDHGRCEDGE